jgi:hypothetical protein
MGEDNKRSAFYSGSINHFRAQMQRLGIEHSGQWLSADGQCLVFWERRQTRRDIVAVTPSSFGGNDHHYNDVDVTPPTRGTWGVWLKLPNGHRDRRHGASIEAFEQAKGEETLIEFLDGRDPYRSKRVEPIGAAFKQFAQWIIDEFQKSPSDGQHEIVKPNRDASLDDWFAYYHNCKRAKIPYTLKELAADVMLSHGYIRQKHSEYNKEHTN